MRKFRGFPWNCCFKWSDIDSGKSLRFPINHIFSLHHVTAPIPWLFAGVHLEWLCVLAAHCWHFRIWFASQLFFGQINCIRMLSDGMDDGIAWRWRTATTRTKSAAPADECKAIQTNLIYFANKMMSFIWVWNIFATFINPTHQAPLHPAMTWPRRILMKRQANVDIDRISLC